MTKHIKELGKREDIKLLFFPFENRNGKTISSEKPSLLTCDSTLITFDSDMKWSNTSKSELFNEIASIIGIKNFNDVRHVDTAFKEGCQLFISPDKKDIVSKYKELYVLTGIHFFYSDDISGIDNCLKSFK